MKVPGVYMIYNVRKDRIYVGSSINIRQRRMRHYKDLRRGIHRSRFMQRDFIATNDESAFLFFVLEYCDAGSIIQREQFWMNLLTPEYNLSPTAGNCLGVKHTKETNERNRERNSGFKNVNSKFTEASAADVIEKLKTRSMDEVAKEYGVYRTTIQRLCKRMGYRHRKVYSEKARAIIAETRKRHPNSAKKKVFEIGRNGDVIAVYDSLKDLSGSIGIENSTLSKFVRSRTIVRGRLFTYSLEPSCPPP